MDKYIKLDIFGRMLLQNMLKAYPCNNHKLKSRNAGFGTSRATRSTGAHPSFIFIIE